MLTDIMVYSELVKNTSKFTKSGEQDTRGGWMDLRDWVIGLIEYCKKSGKTFIFIALEMEVLNEKEFVTETKPKVVGSLKDSLSSHFTTVLRTVVREVDNDIAYQFQTNRTKEDMHTTCKSPMEMLELYEPNDIMLVLNKMKKFYDE